MKPNIKESIYVLLLYGAYCSRILSGAILVFCLLQTNFKSLVSKKDLWIFLKIIFILTCFVATIYYLLYDLPYMPVFLSFRVRDPFLLHKDIPFLLAYALKNKDIPFLLAYAANWSRVISLAIFLLCLFQIIFNYFVTTEELWPFMKIVLILSAYAICVRVLVSCLPGLPFFRLRTRKFRRKK
jgi:hypothetical protein